MKLTTMLTDDAVHARCAGEALALANDYDWKPLAGKTEAIYQSVVR
jgi:hypothetical protein